jgi:2-polyprenyl-3-methyl-5-hydroxy-6-metoxy-1,4-benzoquinol methylase
MSEDPKTAAPRRHHGVCPWWLGYVLASPVRRLFDPPERLLAPLVRSGMTVLEPGCGMGYFSLPLARMVGETGRVVAVDLQPRMIAGLRRRAARAGLADRITASVCGADDLGLGGRESFADLAVAMHMVHEVPDQERLLRQLQAALRPGGTLLVVEPRGHVSPGDLDRTVAIAERAGFTCTGRPTSRRSLGAIFLKPAA